MTLKVIIHMNAQTIILILEEEINKIKEIQVCLVILWEDINNNQSH